MKLVSSKLCLVVASSALLFAGCSKKPERPTPPATAMGMALGPGPIAPPTDVNAAPDTSLQPRLPDGVIDDGNTIRGLLQAVYFDFDQSAVKADQRDKLKAAKEYLEKNPGQRLLLEGHCDWQGTAEYNLGLGDRRASAAKKYLASLGVVADKLESNSKGSLEAAKDGNDAARAKDRRVELVIIKAK
ncbi:MAG: flagellar motor protein MotB [Opitutus sp.]|nr:flagellar motor protein MotB [Opitutus sp.]